MRRTSDRTPVQQAAYNKLRPHGAAKGLKQPHTQSRAIDVAIALKIGTGPVAIDSIKQCAADVFGMQIPTSRIVDDVAYTSGTGKYFGRKTKWTKIDDRQRVIKHQARYKETPVIVTIVESFRAPIEVALGELPGDEKFFEGAVSRVVVNRYERDQAARVACLTKLGNSCDVCGMCFVERYGKIGEDFIHIHHRKPITTRKVEYRVDPVKDLVPVCPNCHAMLHYGRPWDSPLTTDELRGIMANLSGF